MSGMDIRWRTVGRNVLVLLGAILPGFFFLSWLQGRFAAAPVQSVWDSINTGIFFYFVYALPVAAGGLLHSLALGLTQPARHRQVEVSIRIVLTILIPLAVLMAGERLENIWAHGVPLIACLVLYGLLAKRPSREVAAANRTTDS